MNPRHALTSRRLHGQRPRASLPLARSDPPSPSYRAIVLLALLLSTLVGCSAPTTDPNTATLAALQPTQTALSATQTALTQAMATPAPTIAAAEPSVVMPAEVTVLVTTIVTATPVKATATTAATVAATVAATSAPATALPATAIPPTPIPPTAIPATAAPPAPTAPAVATTAPPPAPTMMPTQSTLTDVQIAGLAVYRSKGCIACHTLTIAGAVGTAGPTHNGLAATALQRIADPAYTGTATNAEEYIRESILMPNLYATTGYSPEVMPSFAGISESNLNALVQMLLTE